MSTERTGKWDFEDDLHRRLAIENEPDPMAWVKHVAWATAFTIAVVATAYFKGGEIASLIIK